MSMQEWRRDRLTQAEQGGEIVKLTGPGSISAPGGDPIIFQQTRPSAWPAPDGTTVTVTARRSRNGTVGIHWERSDIDDGGRSVAVTAEELAGIVAAVARAEKGGR